MQPIETGHWIAEAQGYLLGAFAIIFATSSLILCFLKGKTASATLAGGMALLSVLLAYFPLLESLDAFSLVHVKIKRNLEASEKLLEKTKSLAIETASSSLFSLGNTNPFGSSTDKNIIGFPLTEEQRQLINNVLDNVRSMDLTFDQRKKVVLPLLNYVDNQLVLAMDAAVDSAIRASSLSPENKTALQKKEDALNIRFDPKSFDTRKQSLDKILRRLIDVTKEVKKFLVRKIILETKFYVYTQNLPMN